MHGCVWPLNGISRKIRKVREGIGASGAEHQNRLRRKTVFDGSRHGYADGLVNKFPVRRQGHAPRFAPFAWPDTKSSRTDTKKEWQLSSPCLRSPKTPVLSDSNGDWESQFYFRDNLWEFRVLRGRATKWRGNGAALRGGLPTAAWAGLAERRRGRTLPKKALVFHAGGASCNDGFPAQAHTNYVRGLIKMVPEEGVEPTCHRWRQILSLLRLPFRHSGGKTMKKV